jgi:hypothetical protein
VMSSRIFLPCSQKNMTSSFSLLLHRKSQVHITFVRYSSHLYEHTSTKIVMRGTTLGHQPLVTFVPMDAYWDGSH